MINYCNKFLFMAEQKSSSRISFRFNRLLLKKKREIWQQICLSIATVTISNARLETNCCSTCYYFFFFFFKKKFFFEKNSNWISIIKLAVSKSRKKRGKRKQWKHFKIIFFYPYYFHLFNHIFYNVSACFFYLLICLRKLKRKN